MSTLGSSTPERPVARKAEMLVEQYKESFDALMTTDEYGQERWSARDLQPHLGYAKWQNFEEAIDRAKISIQALNMDVTSHVTEASKPITSGKGREQEISDYSLTRFGAYLVAMNGDPRKTEIAQAQAYFAVQTRMAEAEGASRELKKAREKIEDLEHWIGEPRLIERERFLDRMSLIRGSASRDLIDTFKGLYHEARDQNEKLESEKADLQDRLDKIRATLMELP